jgi:DNA topoisomerase IB
MPLGGLVAQLSTTQATSWQLTIPCPRDPKASLSLSLVHHSDYAHWLYKELDARRREEVKGFVWRAPFRRVVKPAKNIADNDDLWALWCLL